jgi:hypothetical protein
MKPATFAVYLGDYSEREGFLLAAMEQAKL